MGIQTEDLWEVARLFSGGGWLEQVEVFPRHDGRKELVFIFNGFVGKGRLSRPVEEPEEDRPTSRKEDRPWRLKRKTSGKARTS